MIYHLDRLIIRTTGYKILVVDYFSERIIQTFKNFVGTNIVYDEHAYRHQMVACASKVSLFFLHIKRLPEVDDDTGKKFTYVYTILPKEC